MDTRIRAALPTISHILQAGGMAILVSHLGRPKGIFDEAYSMRPVGQHLALLTGSPVIMAPAGGLEQMSSKLQNPLPPEKSFFWKTSVLSRVKRKMSLLWPPRWQNWPMCTSMTPSGPPIARNASTTGVAHLMAEKAPGFLIAEGTGHAGYHRQCT